MRLEIAVDMTYDLNGTTALLAVEAAQLPGQVLHGSDLTVEGAEVKRIEGEDGIGSRIWLEVPGNRMNLSYRATADLNRAPVTLATLPATHPRDLPGRVLCYLRPSRFCQADQFGSYVERRFGNHEGGARVAAIRDWVHNELSYVPGASNAMTTVMDTFAAREGVCRDYAHMVCALARAGGIPARYAAVYAPGVEPPDFHAVAQVWLDGAWHIVDATGMADASDAVLIAVGRDACDTAFMETDQGANMVEQSVRVTVAG